MDVGLVVAIISKPWIDIPEHSKGNGTHYSAHLWAKHKILPSLQD